MSALTVYRIIVDEWPTPDGEPWARLYGPAYNTYGREDDVLQPAVPEWLLERVCRSRDWRVLNRVIEDDHGEVSVVMPKPKRKHYLSASGAHELARNMEAFGAKVRVQRSKPVEWLES